MKECLSCKTILPNYAEKCSNCGSVTIATPSQSSGREAGLKGCFFLIALAAFGFFALFKSATSSDPKPSPNPAPVEYKATRIAVEALHAAYDENELAADRKYNGERVEVFGIVADVSKEITGKPYVILVGQKGRSASAQCVFDRSRADSLMPLRKGDSAAFNCEVRGKLVHVQLRDCR